MTNEEFIESIRLENEEWRPVVGFEERYMVSSFGRVASIAAHVTWKDGKHSISKQCLIVGGISQKKSYDKTVYRHYSLWINRVRYCKKAHRMVAEAFIPNPNNYPNIDHIDGNGLNNRVENLRWCTQKMNAHNPITSKRHRDAMTARIGVPKRGRKVVQLDMNNNIIKIYPSITSCLQYGFGYSSVEHTCQGKLQQYKGCKWMYYSDYELLINKSKNPNGSERQLSLPL